MGRGAPFAVDKAYPASVGSGTAIMQKQVVALAAALVMAPLGASAADLVCGGVRATAQEDEAVKEIIAAFEQNAGKQVGSSMVRTSLRTSSWLRSRPGSRPTSSSQWLIPSATAMGLRGSARRPHGRHRPLFRLVRSGRARRRHAARRDDRAGVASTCCRWGLTHHVHAWKSLLERRGSPSRTSPASGRRSGPSGATRCSPRCAEHSAATTSGASASPCRSSRRHRKRAQSVHGRLRGRLRDPRGPAGHRRSGGPAQARQGHRRLHVDLPQGLHPARFNDAGTPTATTSSSWRRPS